MKLRLSTPEKCPKKLLQCFVFIPKQLKRISTLPYFLCIQILQTSNFNLYFNLCKEIEKKNEQQWDEKMCGRKRMTRNTGRGTCLGLTYITTSCPNVLWRQAKWRIYKHEYRWEWYKLSTTIRITPSREFSMVPPMVDALLRASSSSSCSESMGNDLLCNKVIYKTKTN